MYCNALLFKASNSVHCEPDTVLVNSLIVFICYNVCRELLTTSTGTVCPLRIDTVLVSIVWLCNVCLLGAVQHDT